MRCQFCFATFQDVKKTTLPKGHLPREEAVEVVKKLAQFGFQKITFAGGEPTLCKWLTELICIAKIEGLTTMIVTNGTNLTDEFLKANQNNLDWIALSVDSLSELTNIEIGRAIVGKNPIKKSSYYVLVEKIKSYGYGLKINTVVNSKNVNENMHEFIEYAKPYRWKIFQVLPIKGQNDNNINEFVISKNQFNEFVSKHKSINNSIKIIPENNNQMQGSYAMVDPAGRFFDNNTGTHLYSQPILSVGCKNAISKMNYNLEKFNERGGSYDWERKKIIVIKN
jgi:radical S-adenosyl methionine domain-containing protein 2